jgi:DNA-binding GntR family transcriptional regulator
MPRGRPNLRVIRPAAPARPAPGPKRGQARDERADTTTERIVESITSAIVERRLMPGTKLAEQKIADIFKVSRTLVRQALNQLSRDRLVSLEPARGAFVAMPSVGEARQADHNK